MDQPNPTFAKIPILDTGKFEQWKFRIQQYLQNEHYALWEVIEFGDSYKAPQEDAASESSVKKKGRIVVITTEDMQKRRNDVKARTTLLLALPDEHQLRFSKYETAKELWEAILKTFGENKATKKTKKNQLKQQYGNFKAEGSDTLEQTFNRLQAIVSHLEFIDVEIKQDDLNQKFLTSLAQEWLMYTITWRNRDDLNTLTNTSSRKGKINTTNVPTANTQVFPASPNVAATSISHDTVCAYIASQSNGSQIKYKDINQIDEDDIEEVDIKWNMALLTPQEDAASESSVKKKGRTVVITTEDMQKRRNDVKARTTLLLALPDEHQLRFSKYETAKELWEVILKTFGGNEATKKTKKNQLKQQYGNFKAEGSETLEKTFNRLQAIISHLEFMNVEIEQDNLNQKFLTSLAPEWLMYTIMWRNRDDLDTMSLDDVYNHLKVYEPEV
uniref:Uncharacterized protein n=1 Tax=Tanacetum cinerariifolium TaxID=118510 RepID=A0A6L2M7E0_TANCI|nr:hypothetical protein [Tanacetum cinerariifolium]